MAEEQRREDLLGTTDCLEAISVFKGWKNFLFVLAVICLVLLQICFWLVDTNVIQFRRCQRAAGGYRVHQAGISCCSCAACINN